MATQPLNSSVGLKLLVALSGLGLFGFVIMHMLGNWQIFLGPDALNSYAYLLKSNPQILWPARIGLLVIILVHVGATFKIKSRNRKARPDGYASEKSLTSTWASRHMMLTGLVILAFTLFHLAHYTLMLVDPSFADLHDAMGRHDVYTMVVTGFSNPFVAGFYIFAIILLGLHLSHGLSSIWQTLGINNKVWRPYLQKLGCLIALFIVLGNIAMPIAVLAGLIGLPAGAAGL